MAKDTSERDSIRALSADVEETVTLSKEFYSCLVQDVRRVSGSFEAVRIPPSAPIPAIIEAEPDEEPPTKKP
jgi:hypothetical protein